MLDNDGGPTELLGPGGVEARDAESGILTVYGAKGESHRLDGWQLAHDE